MTNFAAHDGDRNAGAEVLLALPWPPSANRLWRSPNKGPLRGRHLLSPEARQYKNKAHVILEALEVEPIPGRVAVDMTAHPPDRRRRDLDNLIKIILDSLKGRAFGDDSNVVDLHIRQGAVEPGGLIRVRVRPITSIP